LKNPGNPREVIEYFEAFKPDALIYLETAFSGHVIERSARYGVKLVGVVMHETYREAPRHLRPKADAFICPSINALNKVTTENKYGLFLPISANDFPFNERTGHSFLLNMGYGGVNDRRQAGKIVEAFKGLEDKDARLYVHAQGDLPPGLVFNDKRIRFTKKDFENPADIYNEGDIALAPMAYGGYERGILEAMARGMPCLTTNADPMNLFQHDPDFLIKPSNYFLLTGGWVHETIYSEVSVEDLRGKMEWLLTIDTARYSRQARQQAEAQSWESKDIDYRAEWWKVLEDICS
jgi:glycosyltransferase involved in cell wall biosynthesis